MFNSGILDVAIGVIFIFLFLSLLCSFITEWIARITSSRSKNLEAGIRSLLSDRSEDGLTKKFYENPLIQVFARKGKKPSYIPARSFALALMNIVAPDETEKGTITADGLREAVGKIENEGLRKTLFILLSDAENSIAMTRQSLENWYDVAMDRVSGWYKRRAQTISLICAIALTVALNADTISIANNLFRDKTLRAGLVAAAQGIAEQQDVEKKDPQAAVNEMQVELQAIAFPVGWSHEFSRTTLADRGLDWWVCKIIGLLITAVAVSLGAPFWFDMLNKFVNMRSSGGKPRKSGEMPEQTPSVQGQR